MDFESVQPASLAVLAPDYFRAKIFVGATQGKLPFDRVAAVQKLGDLSGIVDALRRPGHLSITGGKVVYADAE
jgi:hypothetical protein